MLLSAQEFPFIQPLSVEESKHTHNSYFADSDKDNVSDDKDKCPKTVSGNKVDLFGCALLNDSDNDGVADLDDKCYNTTQGATVNLHGCEPDNDEDGVADARDTCLNTAKEFLVDKDGCPQTAMLKINFQSNTFKLEKKYLNQIEDFALFLEENESYQAIIYGYTDSIEEKNSSHKKLSQSRARVIMNTLINYGIKLTRLTAIGMGIKNPIAENSTSQGRTQNRRIEVELLR